MEQEKEDKKLINNILSGEKKSANQAANILINRIERIVSQVSFKNLNVKDVSGRVLIEVLKAAKKNQLKYPIDGLIATIAKRQFYKLNLESTALKEHQQTPPQPFPEEDRNYVYASNPNEDLIDKVILAQFKLRESCQKLIKLSFYTELSQADIANRLGYQISSIGKIRDRCLKQLKEIFMEISKSYK